MGKKFSKNNANYLAINNQSQNNNSFSQNNQVNGAQAITDGWVNISINNTIFTNTITSTITPITTTTTFNTTSTSTTTTTTTINTTQVDHRDAANNTSQLASKIVDINSVLLKEKHDDKADKIKINDNEFLGDTDDILPSVPSLKLPCCHLTLPAYLTIRCSKLNEPTIQKETICLTELPNTVLDLKHAISVKLDIPIICMLELSVESMRLYDEQSIEDDIPLRDSDELHLVYLYRCQPGQVSALISCFNIISKFSQFALETKSNDLFDAKGTIKNMFVGNEIRNIQWTLRSLSSTLQRWGHEHTECVRLFLMQEDIIAKVRMIWDWSSKSQYLFTMQEVCLSVLWNFQENVEERILLLIRGAYERALELFFSNEVGYNVKQFALGLVAGCGEFSLGQKQVGTNQTFLANLVTFFKQNMMDTRVIVSDMLFSLSSSPIVIKVMLQKNILKPIFEEAMDVNFCTIDTIDLTSRLCMYFMVCLKYPNYNLANVINLQNLKKMLSNYQGCELNLDERIAQVEEEGVSWASMVPFIDFFFIPTHSHLNEYEGQCPGLLEAYYGVARISLSAVLLLEKNRELCLDENLYGYLIILYWRQAKHPDNKRLLHGILNRFNPIPYRIPSLLQIATAQHAFNNQGLLAALDIL